MKTDLATSIGMAVLGAVMAFVVCNMLFGEIEDVSFKTSSGKVDTTLLEPDEEVFNYKALNPTVEVYIGE
jgi:hypothetical protein